MVDSDLNVGNFVEEKSRAHYQFLMLAFQKLEVGYALGNRAIADLEKMEWTHVWPPASVITTFNDDFSRNL